MYVCLCHSFNERQVEQAFRQGAQSASAIYRHFGVRPRCGRCVDCLKRMIAEMADRQAVPGP